ncbi:hypothetical protein Acr_00g0012130 [Actinidia rufa]|uniref:Serpin domain-containing protein n=1 Tax=Actinidia rufa TaxID=165716 RepID=A0A7J0DBG8_9ERIC|nr:hypothetical protein Acr_00g0012130 [Actinidia rufa]
MGRRSDNGCKREAVRQRETPAKALIKNRERRSMSPRVLTRALESTSPFVKKPTMDCPAKKPISNLNSPFCIQMVNQVILKQIAKGSNLVLSPLSFHVMLSLIAAGSTGRTLEQLLSHLESTSIDDLNKISSQSAVLTSMHSERNDLISSLIVSFANGLWVDRSFTLKPSFEKIVKGVYRAEAKEVDFANKETSGIVFFTGAVLNPLLVA